MAAPVYAQGELLLALLVFSDGAGAKRRPVLVVRDFGDADLLVVPVTSHPARAATDVVLSDWKGAGLKLPSTVRAEKLATISKSCVVRKLGVLQSADLAMVRETWKATFQQVVAKDLEKYKSDITEDLATLYLRLNGYFTTGFILHSPQRGAIHTEIDCIAVRFPLSSEPERGIGPDPHLCPSATQIDVVICEVKRRGEPLQFNKALRKEIERFDRILRWIGLFEESQITQLAPQVMAALTPKDIASPSVSEVSVDKTLRIRGLLFSPERNNSKQKRTEPFFIGGDTIFDYTWKCLCPNPAEPEPSARGADGAVTCIRTARLRRLGMRQAS